MTDIDHIKIILEKIRTNDDRKNVLTKSQYLNNINKNGYNIEEILTKTDKKLKEKYLKYTDDTTFFRDCLYEYAAMIIPLIKKDYKDYLDAAAMTRLDSLLKEHKIKIKDEEKMENISEKDKGYYGGGAHSDGTIDISMPQGNIIRGTRQQLGVLLHEIFHQTHRWRIGIDLNYTIDGTFAKALNNGGFIIEEGLTDKCAIDFARKYNLPCKPSYTYYLYVELVSKMEEVLSLENGQLFNTNYHELFNIIDKSGKLLKQYEITELYRYTSFFQKTKDNVVTFNYNGKTYKSNSFPEFDEKMKKSLSVDSKEKERTNLNNSLDEIKKQHQEEDKIAPAKTDNDKITKIQERKTLLGQYAMILQEIKRRKEIENTSLTTDQVNKSRGVIDTFTCILFALAISILTFTVTYFFLANTFKKH